MQVIELKNIIIQRISEINDIPFLEKIEKMLDLKKETKIFHLNDSLKKEIAESKKEIHNGLFIKHEIIDEEINKWLQEK